MIDTTIHTFEQCIGIANRYVRQDGTPIKKNLILGNGFSIAFRSDIFSYKALADCVKSPRVKDLFDKLNTSDFEYVMQRLTNALKLIDLYPKHEEISVGMENDLDELHDTLIEAISESHPVSSREIDDEQYESCRLFLANFESGNKYTFNYDLLLYWVYIKFLKHREEEKRLDINDGFGNTIYDDIQIITWDISRTEKQNVYYLHGAMHLFNNKGMIRKFSWARNETPISVQVRNAIYRMKYPMFISEGTKKHKLSRIRNCSYLDHAFHSLKDIDDNLFIFGHSLGDEDDHVFERVNIYSEKLKNVFISIYGDVNSIDNQRTMNKVNRWARLYTNKNYYFYDAVSANVWGTP